MLDLAYPHTMAAFILERWQRAHTREDGTPDPWGDQPPSSLALERLVAVCFQASLLREESRPVTFRLILAEPALFPCDQGPPDGLHCLRFSQPRPFNPLEARRLSPAANFYRSLIGVCLDEKTEQPKMWGILHSGLRWLQNVHGGRGRVQTLPPALVLSVTGPGRITVGFGSELICHTEGGTLLKQSPNVFESKWMRETFEPTRNEQLDLIARLRAEEGADWPPLDPMLLRVISQHAIKRVISALRGAHHGATILLMPTDLRGELSDGNRYIDLKYRFAEGEPRHRFRTLVTNIVSRVCHLHAGRNTAVGWTEYALSNDADLGDFDEAIFEMAYLIAGCAEVDGAVVLTKNFEVLGFGGEISGELPGVVSVRQALDLEGETYEDEITQSVGTRHRSAYRLCLAVPGALAIVISQDGAVRFVRNHRGAVTYWDQASTTSLDV